MKLLVATDGSKAALHAVKYAIALVRQLAAGSNSITLIGVHDDAAYRHAEYFVGKKVVADYLRETSEKELKPARKLLDGWWDRLQPWQCEFDTSAQRVYRGS